MEGNQGLNIYQLGSMWQVSQPHYEMEYTQHLSQRAVLKIKYGVLRAMPKHKKYCLVFCYYYYWLDAYYGPGTDKY